MIWLLLMNAYVIDTHAWIWQLFNPKKLGTAARECLALADNNQAHVHIPAVVMAELLMVAEKRRVAELTPELVPRIVESVNTHPGYHLEPLTPEIVLASHNLTAIPDIFDRLIVSEALQRQADLLTNDSVIQNSELVSVIWDSLS